MAKISFSIPGFGGEGLPQPEVVNAINTRLFKINYLTDNTDRQTYRPPVTDNATTRGNISYDSVKHVAGGAFQGALHHEEMANQTVNTALQRAYDAHDFPNGQAPNQQPAYPTDNDAHLYTLPGGN